MRLEGFYLAQLSAPLKIALTCVLLILAGGYAASLYYLVDHVSKKDNDPELTYTDLIATYHGVDKPAPLLTAISDGTHDSWLKGELVAEEKQVLIDWLSGSSASRFGNVADPIQTGYDAIPDGASEDMILPADVIDDRCIRCHGPSAKDPNAAESLALHDWTAVKNYAYAKKFEPISTTILAQSTHAHALSIPIFTLLAALCLLATGWPRWLRHGAVMLTFVGLLLDFGGMWLGRLSESAVLMVPIGGAAYGLGLGLMIGLSLLSMWFGSSSHSDH